MFLISTTFEKICLYEGGRSWNRILSIDVADDSEICVCWSFSVAMMFVGKSESGAASRALASRAGAQKLHAHAAGRGRRASDTSASSEGAMQDKFGQTLSKDGFLSHCLPFV